MPSPSAPPPIARPTPTHLIGVGASAGGLAPILAFVGALPSHLGLALVVVQHLAADQPSALAELIRSHTTWRVQEGAEGIALQVEHIYVIPPGCEMRVDDGARLRVEVAVPTAPAHQIDTLFRSMAQSFGAQAVGVVMSGLGSDGSAGLRDIVDHGGLGAVQLPDTAEFDPMPRSALAIGPDLVVGPPEALPALIVAALAAPRLPHLAGALPGDEPTMGSLAGLPAILRQVAIATSHDFSEYKASTLARRVARRMAIHSLESMEAYARLLVDNPQESELLCKELLIGVTDFFRDPTSWEALRTTVLPDLVMRAARRPEPTFRAWVAGCSTGEEAYTLGMLLQESMATLPPGTRPRVQILATDLSADAIDVARRGIYPASITSQVSPMRLRQFFVREGNGTYRVAKPLRDMVIFARHDLLTDAPFIRLDLLTCRNVLIYFTAALQARILPLFHYALLPGGCLMLGNAETVNRFDSALPAIDAKLRLYRRSADALPNIAACFPLRATTMSASGSEPEGPATGAAIAAALQLQADRMLLDEFAPPAVLVNALGDILYVSGRTGRFLEPAAGKANWNIHAMAREGMRSALGSALRDARTESREVVVADLALRTDGGELTLDLIVRPIHMTGQVALWLVLFREHPDAATPSSVAGPERARRRLEPASAGDQALEAALAEVRRLREEMHASREELQSANEELQSTNEELQSANEELTTSKEEMQAMNEELQTVNAELLAKLEDLAVTQSDLKNLLNSTQIATLFLDSSMNVRRFTEQAKLVIKLREGDIGRPLSDLTTTLEYPTLGEDIAQVLRTLAYSEKSVRSSDDRWYSVRIMPYRTQDNVIAGSVITFVDITAAKNLEARLRSSSPGDLSTG